jgi:hypothetical protein
VDTHDHIHWLRAARLGLFLFLLEAQLGRAPERLQSGWLVPHFSKFRAL